MNNQPAPVATKIMLIRHAEKPVGDSKGVTPLGIQSPESLIVKGWQRAGALAVLFGPANDPLHVSQISVPDAIYACQAWKEGESMRSEESVTSLSELLNISINKNYGKSDCLAMTDHAMMQSGTVLISWKHEDIPTIANRILSRHESPQSWPDERFDVVWIFVLDSSTGEYTFSQVPQNLLPGDQNSIIS